MVYPNEDVADYLQEHFVPAQIEIGENPVLEERYAVAWTPTLLFIGDDKHLQYKEEAASYPPDDFLAKLKVGRARAIFQNESYKRALSIYDGVLEEHPDSIFVPEALYWSGVAKLKRDDKEGLLQRWGQIKEQYPESTWAQRLTFLDED